MLKSLTMDCQDYWLFKKYHPVDISVVNSSKPCKTPASDMELVSFWGTLNFEGTHFYN